MITEDAGEASESKAWMGVLAFFVVVALLGPTLLFRAVFDPDRGKPPRKSPDGQYSTHGTVESVEIRERRVTIAHDAIPGVMPEMTMPFTVENERLLNGLEPGDHVDFRFTIRDRTAWIDQLGKQDAAADARR